jgi:hypothetical protein
MLSEHPNISQLAHGRVACLVRYQIFRLLAFVTNTLDNDIDLGRLETRQQHIETDIDQTLKLDRK